MPALRTTRLPRSDNRQPELLDAAAALFAQRGYAATSMRDIALAVKMLPGSMYYHFASKEELLVAVYEAGVGVQKQMIARASMRFSSSSNCTSSEETPKS